MLTVCAPWGMLDDVAAAAVPGLPGDELLFVRIAFI
jgi:hypothetical protein